MRGLSLGTAGPRPPLFPTVTLRAINRRGDPGWRRALALASLSLSWVSEAGWLLGTDREVQLSGRRCLVTSGQGPFPCCRGDREQALFLIYERLCAAILALLFT